MNPPNNPFDNLALSMSGGGYRAAAFHLGVLKYLSEIMWFNKSLLDRIVVLSTVSGGTFVGVKYVTTLKNGGTLKDCYDSLYQFMSNTDLIKEALSYLRDDNNWKGVKERTLITAFASIYHSKLEGNLFELLWNDTPDIHIKEICFNATEFNFALPFRFQKTGLKETNFGLTHGYVGNNEIRIPLDIAKKIRLADIIAASSCFPIGFEPINFPEDFIHSENRFDSTKLPVKSTSGQKINYPIGLMDGGIDDNQGIEAVFLAEQRLQRNNQKLQQGEKAIDLFIVSDVSSPLIDHFIRSESVNIPIIGNLKMRSFDLIGFISGCIMIFSLVTFCCISNKWQLFLSAAISIFASILTIASFTIAHGFTRFAPKLGVPEFFISRLNVFESLRVNTLVNLLVNRFQSGKIMVANVFMTQIRRFAYSKVYRDSAWLPRLITNAIYELTPTEINNNKNSKLFRAQMTAPSAELSHVAQKAANMGTSLWFTQEELEKENMLNSLIACGQFTMCFNLLHYMEQWQISPENERYQEIQDELSKLQKRLLDDWASFNVNPYCKIDSWNGH